MHYHESSINGVQCVRKYRFEAAHGIRGYSIHGHNYELNVLLQGIPDPKTSMVIELSQIDSIVKKEIIDRFDHRFMFYHEEVHTHELFSAECSSILEDKIPFYYGLLLVEEEDRIYSKILKGEDFMVYKTHIFKFSAAHQLYNSELDKAENEKHFGKCQRLHGHNYTLSVTVSGTPDDYTGSIIVPNLFDSLIEKIVQKYDHKQLDELEIFVSNNKVATTENFVKILWDQIKIKLEDLIGSQYIPKNLKLDSIALQETDRNLFVYKGE